jgi:hypothetical protein
VCSCTRPEKRRIYHQSVESSRLVPRSGMRVRTVLEAGADSAAVLTEISRNADPKQRARDWVKATREKAICIE